MRQYRGVVSRAGADLNNALARAHIDGVEPDRVTAGQADVQMAGRIERDQDVLIEKRGVVVRRLHIVGAGERQDRPRAWPGKGLASHVCESALDRGTAIPGDQARKKAPQFLRAVFHVDPAAVGSLVESRPLLCWKADGHGIKWRRRLLDGAATTFDGRSRSAGTARSLDCYGRRTTRDTAANDAVERLVVEFGRTGSCQRPCLSWQTPLQRCNLLQRIAKGGRISNPRRGPWPIRPRSSGTTILCAKGHICGAISRAIDLSGRSSKLLPVLSDLHLSAARQALLSQI